MKSFYSKNRGIECFQHFKFDYLGSRNHILDNDLADLYRKPKELAKSL